MRFFVAQQSGLWNAPVSSWRRAVDNAVAAKASVILFTETTQSAGATITLCVPEGWKLARKTKPSGASECSVLYKKDIWEPAIKPYATQIATTRTYNGDYLLPPAHSICVPLRHHTGNVVNFQSAHLAAGVEGPGKLKGRPEQVQSWNEGADGTKDAWDKARDELDEAVYRVLGVDVNLNYRRDWVKTLIDEEWPGLKSAWIKMPPVGTHAGNRVIDQILVDKRLSTKGSTLLPPVPGFDHVGQVATIRLKAA